MTFRKYIVFFFAVSIPLQVQGQIIISQYYEGLKLNKWIEVTNVGKEPVNLNRSPHYLLLYANERAQSPETIKPSFAKKLSGVIKPGQSLLFRNALTKQPNYAMLEGVGATIGAFNGDDIIVLSTAKGIDGFKHRIDMIGNNSQWGTDQIFVRKPTIKNGSKYFIKSQWISTNNLNRSAAYDKKDSFTLGIHLFNIDEKNDEEEEDENEILEEEQEQGIKPAEKAAEKAAEKMAISLETLPDDLVTFRPNPFLQRQGKVLVNVKKYMLQTFDIKITNYQGKRLMHWSSISTLTVKQKITRFVNQLPPSLYVMTITNDKYLQVLTISIE